MENAIIIDDEQHCIDRLKDLLLNEYKNTLDITGTFQSVDDGLKGIKELNPGLVFLDVQIHEKTGFDLLKELGKVNFEIIFTTAYDKFAVQAFRFSALDYLLKPVDRYDLRLAMDKYWEIKNRDNANNRLQVLLDYTKSKTHIPGRIVIPTRMGFEIIEITEIIRCESSINYTTIHLKDKQKLVVAKTLKEFEEMLSDLDFFRIHNSHLVNLAYIKRYNRERASVVLTDGMELEVSTRRKDDFLKKLSGK